MQAHWAKVVGEEVAAHAWPTALRQGVLTVAVDHHAWAIELRLLSADLLSVLQVPCPTVQAIAVQVSPLPPQDRVMAGQLVEWYLAVGSVMSACNPSENLKPI